MFSCMRPTLQLAWLKDLSCRFWQTQVGGNYNRHGLISTPLDISKFTANIPSKEAFQSMPLRDWGMLTPVSTSAGSQDSKCLAEFRLALAGKWHKVSKHSQPGPTVSAAQGNWGSLWFPGPIVNAQQIQGSTWRSLSLACMPHICTSIDLHSHMHFHSSTYIYIYASIHPSTYTYMQTYIHLHTHTYICIYIHLFIHLHIHMYIHPSTCIYKLSFIYLHTHACIHLLTYLYIIHTHIYIHIYIYIYTYTHIYIYLIHLHIHMSIHNPRV